jgi:hypothetical protein
MDDHHISSKLLVDSVPPMRYFGILRAQVHLQGLAEPKLPKVRL